MARTPRPYQSRVVDVDVPAHWRQQRRSVCVVAPVGAGKSFIAELLALKVLQHSWAQVFWLAHRDNLLTAPEARFEDGGVRRAFIKAGEAEDNDAPLQFCQVQTLARRVVKPARKPDGTLYNRAVVLWDEAHTIKAAQNLAIRERLLQTFEFVYVVGFTATPYRLDGRGLGDVFEALVEAATPRQLVGEGTICEPVYWSQPAVDVGLEEDAETQLLRPGIVGDVVATWQLRGEGLPTICRAVSIAHSKALTERFRAAGVRCEHIDGSMSASVRRRLLARLSIGGVASKHSEALDVLCAGSAIFDEGLDSRACWEMLDTGLRDRETWCEGLCDSDGAAPEYRPLCVLVDAAPTASAGMWFQRLGRVCRSWPTKKKAIALVHSGNLERHGYLIEHEGFSLAADASWALKIKQRDVAGLSVRKPPQCPQCLCIDVPGSLVCRNCGGTLVQPVVLPKEDSRVKLIEKTAISAPVQPSSPGLREAYLRARYSEMRARVVGGLTPYKANWAAVRHWKRFGFWPDGGLDRRLRREYGIDKG